MSRVEFGLNCNSNEEELETGDLLEPKGIGELAALPQLIVERGMVSAKVELCVCVRRVRRVRRASGLVGAGRDCNAPKVKLSLARKCADTQRPPLAATSRWDDQ